MSANTRIKPKLLTIDGLAAMLSLNPKWIKKRTGPKAKQKIPHVKMGRLVRFDIESEDFQQWLNSLRRN